MLTHHVATTISSNHQQLDRHVIYARIFPLVRADAVVTIKCCKKLLKQPTDSSLVTGRFGWQNRRQLHRSTGIWEESYAELSRWILGVQSTMDGTMVLLKTFPVRNADQVDESTVYFHRLFWTFPPCIKAFRHYKPLININGTHLYGKYDDTLLLAIAQDEGILVISDRHNGIKATLEAPDIGWLPPHAYRAFFIRHVAANFGLSFKDQDARQLLVNAAYTKTKAEFDYWFDIMRNENPTMCDWTN
ncbi:uncharacterized protein LOC130978425 [Arachis stenosperma]|uniref:uncharacterized protein LOC130978425 n=1 Tax=Arachis stenosperma TaxID=217475 RepID=UPI0025ABA803|nr:uncharacterized protein LOC130978425 [Arachis stenosperma]